MEMKKKVLVLLVSAALLVACKGGKENADVKEANSDSTAAVASVAPGASIQELTNEQAEVAQKEFLKVLSIKDQSLVAIMGYSQSFAPAPGTKQDTDLIKKNAALLEDKMFQETRKIQQKLNGLKVTNQDIKNYIADQSRAVDLGKKVYAAKSQIEKENKETGKLSESSEALLKDVQVAQAKVLQDEMVLTERLAQIGTDSPARELLQLKRIQNKEALQLAAATQTLFSDPSLSKENKAKKYIDISLQANGATVSDLKKITFATPDIEAYRKQLLALAQLKAESLKQAPDLQKQFDETKQLSPAAKEMMTKLQKAGIEAESTRIQLTAKYAQ